MDNLEKHFTDIYYSNAWHGKNSKSGTGSDLDTTDILRPQMVSLINGMGIRTIIDAPCGDFFWMKEIINDLNISRYTGVDIVEDMISKNIELYGGSARVEFRKMDITKEILPKAQLIFSRDCLVHFSYETAKVILRNFIASGCEYILMTTFMRSDRNYPDIVDGQWRAINFQIPPMSLPEPERIIIEGCIEDKYRWTDKCLGLWRTSELKGRV